MMHPSNFNHPSRTGQPLVPGLSNHATALPALTPTSNAPDYIVSVQTDGVLVVEAQPVFAKGDRVKITTPFTVQFGIYQCPDPWGHCIRINGSSTRTIVGPLATIELDTRPATTPTQQAAVAYLTNLKAAILSRYLLVTNVPHDAVLSLELSGGNGFEVLLDPDALKDTYAELLGRVATVPVSVKLGRPAWHLSDTFSRVQLETVEWAKGIVNET